MGDPQNLARRAARTAFPSLWGPILVALGYYLGAKLGFALTLAPIPVSTLWPPNAILLAGLLLIERRAWPLTLLFVLAAHLAVQFQSGVPPGMILSWYISNCTEALLGAGLLRRFAGGARSFDTFRDTVLFLACITFASFATSFLDAAFVAANAFGDAGYWTNWRTRFFSNVLAAITLVPFIVMSAAGLTRLRSAPRRKLAEAVVGFIALGGICWFVFVEQLPGPRSSPALLYAPLPLLVGAAVRLGPWGASASVLMCALIAIRGATVGQGPFVTSSPLDNALSIQLFLIVTWIPVMSLAAVIRERASAEAKARWSEEQLGIAIDAAQLGRWEWDIVTGTLTWSDVTRRIYEVPPDVEVSPQTYEALIHPDDRPLIAAATADALNGRDVDVEFRILFPDGRIKWILSKGKTVFDEAGRPCKMIGIKVDISQRKAADLLIHEQQRELAQRSRVAVAGELSIALAHEVNQPLAAILANASAARRFLLHNPPDLQQLNDIVKAIAHDNRRAADVIVRFGALLRKSDHRRTRLEINEVVQSVLDVARADIISRGASLTKQLGHGLPPVLGDGIELQQVLLNLIINACDAVECTPIRARRVVLATRAEGESHVQVTVADNGAGVPTDLLERIFDPFVTSKPERLGLGLAICRSIISAHEGRLWAESRPGGGTEFSFVLPAASLLQTGRFDGAKRTDLA